MDFHTALGKMSSYGDRHLSQRRPHEHTAPSSTINIQTLINKLKTVQCENTESMTLDACVVIYDTLMKLEVTPDQVISHLHTSCLADSFIIRPVAQFLAKTIKRDVAAGNILRSKWLSMLQKNFENREIIFQEAFDTFLNLILIHGETYNAFIVATEKIQVLAPPLINYLDMALNSGSPNALEMLVLQLVINGKCLQQQDKTQYDELQCRIRKVMLEAPTALHLLAIDVISSNIFESDGPITNFYKTELKEVYTFLECRAKGLPFTPAAKPVVKLTSDLSVSSSASASGIPDVNEVRERMRAKGILPRKSSTPKKIEASHDENDDDFYGVQLPRSHILDKKASDLSKAKSVALPLDEWE